MDAPCIVALGRESLPACAEIIRASFATVAGEFGYTRENCPTHSSFIEAERLERDCDGGARPFGYMEDRRLVGYVSLRDKGDGNCELNHLAVLPAYRGQGIGGALLAFCKAEALRMGCRGIDLSIVEDNARLKVWYEAQGFVSTGTARFDGLPFAVGYMAWRENQA